MPFLPLAAPDPLPRPLLTRLLPLPLPSAPAPAPAPALAPPSVSLLPCPLDPLRSTFLPHLLASLPDLRCLSLCSLVGVATSDLQVRRQPSAWGTASITIGYYLKYLT